MLAVVKPSPLRLWGFLLTVIGGALMAFGSIGDWAAVSLGGSTENAVPTKGIDLWQGKVTLLIGALIIVGILALRFVRPERRNAARPAAIVVLGAIGFGVALWCVIALDSVVRDTGIDALVELVVTQLGLSRPRRAVRCSPRSASAASRCRRSCRSGSRWPARSSRSGRVRGPGVGTARSATPATRSTRTRSPRARRGDRGTPRRTPSPRRLERREVRALRADALGGSAQRGELILVQVELHDLLDARRDRASRARRRRRRRSRTVPSPMRRRAGPRGCRCAIAATICVIDALGA